MVRKRAMWGSVSSAMPSPSRRHAGAAASVFYKPDAETQYGAYRVRLRCIHKHIQVRVAYSTIVLYTNEEANEEL